ncbi:putative gluconeogenesis factor [Trueperella bernardiae]|uniref:Putative gluconeogenesis factor n=1 Tax=Trueperella bernardiae TaxID=59561 RepID=A0A0W1KLV4_9ACTO|nr:uridine diphosphate-N-acetylglucosamine-binding protein YvcK [Trueperella bernardiae]KTF05025.1 putative gluconeogenesis factor [Trueperella bernardiae]
MTSGARGAKVVALGGGHGLFATLSALRLLTRNITAIVTVADDGGSSGRLREEFDILPPGDLRMALSALCDDGEWALTWRDVMQYRFTSEGPLNGHSLGNLLITGVWDLLGDQVKGLDLVGRLLDAAGTVLPMSSTPLRIEAEVCDDSGPHTIFGQAGVATCKAEIKQVRLIPENPPAVPEAIAAIHDADWVIFGPGSWFTSVIPHLLVPELYEALAATPAKRALLINLVPDDETRTLSPADHVRSFHEHAPSLALDRIVIDDGPGTHWGKLSREAEECGAEILARPLADRRDPARHDVLFLASALRELLGSSPRW